MAIKPKRPCIVSRCQEYTTATRCEAHQAEAVKARVVSGGTTGPWRRARKIALARAGNRCEKCGRTAAQAKADGTWLEVHHRSGAGVRAAQHDQADLQVLCRQPCHMDTLRAKTRPTLAEHQAALRDRFQA